MLGIRNSSPYCVSNPLVFNGIIIMKIQVSLYILAAILGFGSVVSAQAADDFLASPDKPGSDKFYGGTSIGYGSSDCSYASIDCAGVGMKIFAGYKFNDNVAIEGGYHKLFNAEETLGSNTVQVEGSGLSLNALGIYPVSPQLDVFGKVGLMAWEESAKTNNATNGMLSGSDLLLGAGADYKVNENWGIRGEYEHVGGLMKSHAYTMGATYSTY